MDLNRQGLSLEVKPANFFCGEKRRKINEENDENFCLIHFVAKNFARAAFPNLNPAAVCKLVYFVEQSCLTWGPFWQEYVSFLYLALYLAKYFWKWRVSNRFGIGYRPSLCYFRCCLWQKSCWIKMRFPSLWIASWIWLLFRHGEFCKHQTQKYNHFLPTWTFFTSLSAINNSNIMVSFWKTFYIVNLFTGIRQKTLK